MYDAAFAARASFRENLTNHGGRDSVAKLEIGDRETAASAGSGNDVVDGVSQHPDVERFVEHGIDVQTFVGLANFR